MFELKGRAHKLRLSGKSLLDISKELGIAKSTASLWCAEIKLTPKQEKNLREKQIAAGHKGRLIGAQMNHKKKLDRIKVIEKWAEGEINRLDKSDMLFTNTALYWAEGGKSENASSFIFVNSDPDMILIMYKWLKDYFKIRLDDFAPRVHVNESHKYRIKDILQFWSNLLELPSEQFGKPYFVKVKTKNIYENHDEYFGVLRLKVRKSRDLKYKMIALINQIKKMSA